MAQNTRDPEQAKKDWKRNRLEKMDTRVLTLLEKAARQCQTRGDAPTVLEIGAGSGADAKKIYVDRLGAHVTATDATPVMTEFKEIKEEKKIEFIKDTWPKLEKIGDRTFDIVISNRVLQEISEEEQLQAVQRAVELTKPGGIAIIVYQGNKTREGQFSVKEQEIAKGLDALNEGKTPSQGHLFYSWKSDAKGESATPALDGKERDERVLLISPEPQKAMALSIREMFQSSPQSGLVLG